jgi:hypothetical protein
MPLAPAARPGMSDSQSDSGPRVTGPAGLQVGASDRGRARRAGGPLSLAQAANEHRPGPTGFKLITSSIPKFTQGQPLSTDSDRAARPGPVLS